MRRAGASSRRSAVSSLNHPHILTVHDSGEFAGREYLVTEFVDGGTLKAWRDAEPRTWRQIVELLVGIADALAAAHDSGILHRDVKPGNILVARNGYAKLADFGLAKLAGSAIALQENFAEAHAGLSWALQSQVSNGVAPRSEAAGLLLAAERSAKRAIGIDGDLAEAHTALGGVRFEFWDWAGTTEAYEKALSLNEMAIDCGCYGFVLRRLRGVLRFSMTGAG